MLLMEKATSSMNTISVVNLSPLTDFAIPFYNHLQVMMIQVWNKKEF